MAARATRRTMCPVTSSATTASFTTPTPSDQALRLNLGAASQRQVLALADERLRAERQRPRLHQQRQYGRRNDVRARVHPELRAAARRQRSLSACPSSPTSARIRCRRRRSDAIPKTVNRFTGGATLNADAWSNDKQSLKFVGAAGADIFNQRDAVVAPPESVSSRSGSRIRVRRRSATATRDT